MVDWSKGYSASFYAELVDTATWRDVGVIEIEKMGEAPNIKRVRTLVPMDTWRQQNPIVTP